MAGIDMQSIMQLLQSKRGSKPAGVASGGRQLPMEAIQRRLVETLSGGGEEPQGINDLQGLDDARGPVGILSRGRNMYPGGGPAQQGGGQQFGRPSGGGMSSEQPVPGGQIPDVEYPVEAQMQGTNLPPKNAVLRRILAQRGSGGNLFS